MAGAPVALGGSWASSWPSSTTLVSAIGLSPPSALRTSKSRPSRTYTIGGWLKASSSIGPRMSESASIGKSWR